MNSEALPAQPMEHGHPARGRFQYWLFGVLLLGVVVSFSQSLVTVARPLNYMHAWVTADFALQARSFSNAGVVALRAIPFSNNPPFGLRPEPYLHWPPLFPILLSFVFRIFGDSAASIHGFMLAIQVATAVIIYLLIRTCAGNVAAAFGLLAWLSQAVVLKYSHLGAQLNLAILLLVLSIYLFRHAAGAVRHRALWIFAGAVTVFFGVLTSWEVVLAPLGLLAGSLWTRDREQRRIALIFLATGIVGAFTVLGWYAFVFPVLARDTLTTVLFRMGLGDLHSSSLIYHLDERNMYPYLSLPQRAALIGHYLVTELGGGLGLLAIAAFICRHLESPALPTDNRSVTVFTGLLVPPLAWFIVFSNHAAYHEYQYLLAAPAAAFAIGWCADALLHFIAARQSPSTRVRTRAAAIIGPLIFLLPILSDASSNLTIGRSGDGGFPVLKPEAALMQPYAIGQFGSDIQRGTPQGSVVMTPELNEVPIYYSHRHVIAGVTDANLAQVLALAKTDFPDSALYLAFYRDGQTVITKVAR